MAAEASAEAGTDAQATVTPDEGHETQAHDGREQSADNEHSSEPAPKTTAHEVRSPKSPSTTQTNHSSSPGVTATTGASTGIGSGTPHFVAPSDLLRSASARAGSPFKLPSQHKKPMSAVDRDQIDGLRAIRAFLKVRTSYDVLPLSYRLIIFDTSLLVKKSLNILTQSQIVSAPLWDSKTSTFAGLLTTSDYLNVVQYYWQNPDALAQVDQFKLNSLRDIERAIGVAPIETVSINPHKPLYEACRRMLESRARRIPLVDVDDETQREMVVSVVTQYRILKFVSVNVKETQWLKKPLRDLQHYGVGSYENLVTAHMDTPVMDVIHQLVKRSISSVPILDEKDGTVLNVFEAVDVISLIKGGDYESLNLTVGRALEKRSDDFPGIYTCTLNDRLETIFDTIRKSRVHRLIVIDEQSQLKGVLSLSDILDYTLNSPLGDEGEDGR
ncbi:CBS-domain-containing protein [Teratosphaeria nubilosa]|uniref:CBS-domain-containing protein n=1 Tax=Teratosphaeria nubilosa TaxID=161662 RepID=A0A6G1LJX9_9PEZI|nr:CBS-domain-containing protein [Teratosphaeria nubilosa]